MNLVLPTEKQIIELLGYYVARPFNFFVSPIVDPMFNLDRTFLSQASSLEMLLSQGMDFNRLIRYGIRYLSRSEEEEIRQNEVNRVESVRENVLIDEGGERFLAVARYTRVPNLLIAELRYRSGLMILRRKDMILSISRCRRHIINVFYIKPCQQCFPIYSFVCPSGILSRSSRIPEIWRTRYRRRGRASLKGE